MSLRFDCEQELDAGLQAAAEAIASGGLVVLPTDTVYGVGANAFSPEDVAKLLSAKGRGRDMPPPVLLSKLGLLDTLAIQVPPWLRSMLTAIWPGPLTVIVRSNPSLAWDLGDTAGTVALRMPDNQVARQLIDRTGPLAVSSANLSGYPAATTADEAAGMLADSVDVYLDGGPAGTGVSSTILDVTASTPTVLRAGGVDLATLHQFNNTIVDGTATGSESSGVAG